MSKLVFPEVVACIVNQLNESDEDSPGMGPVHNQTLQQNSVLSVLGSPQHLSLQTMIAEHSSSSGCGY